MVVFHVLLFLLIVPNIRLNAQFIELVTAETPGLKVHSRSYVSYALWVVVVVVAREKERQKDRKREREKERKRKKEDAVNLRYMISDL